MDTPQDKRAQVKKSILEDRLRRRREIILIAAFVGLIGLMFFIELHLSDIADKSPYSSLTSGVIFFLFWNLIVILALVMIFYTMRNVVKLVFERRRGLLGSRLRYRLVAAFIGLTIGPAAVLFGMSAFFLNMSIERWFDPQVQTVFDTSREIIKNKYDDDGESVLHFARQLSGMITKERLLRGEGIEKLSDFIEAKRDEFDLSSIEVYSAKGEALARVFRPDLPLEELGPPSKEALDRALGGQEGYFNEQLGAGDIIRGFEPVMSSWAPQSEKPVGVVVVNKYIERSLAQQLRKNIQAIEEYEQLKRQEPFIKRQHFTLLIFITMGVILLAVWFGLYMSKGITVPIQLLAEGTQAVAAGDLDYRIEADAEDELGLLVQSFNRMTVDLSASRSELDQRRRYMEIVLGNVTAGVISLDGQDNISTINKAAVNMLGLSGIDAFGQNLAHALDDDYVQLIDELNSELADSKENSVRRQVSLHKDGRTLAIVVTLTALEDDEGNYLGLVAVIEDITDMFRAQRAMAWREVARRIAHEIKNPLTPIKLTAQRLDRRYRDKENDEEAKLITEAVRTIIRQVDELKNLVNEFSAFARLPSTNPMASDLNRIIREVAPLYREAHRDITFEIIEEKRLPAFDLDPEQMNRVFINLLDNAVASIEGKGNITIETMYNEQLQIARVEIRDTGCGISPRDKDKLFEPYFSTKAHGSGLGLAIVHRIISDHNGYIRVADNSPKGTVMIIELPVVQADTLDRNKSAQVV